MSSTLNNLRQKLNEACILLVEKQPYCILCEAKLPSRANYDSHTNGKNHVSKSNYIFEQLMKAVLTPGITITKSDSTEDTTSVNCVLCKQEISNLFDSSFHDHINCVTHQNKVQWQMNQQRIKGLDTFYTGSVVSDKAEDVLIKGVSRAVIIVANDGCYHCVTCDCKLNDKEQFMHHVRGVTHQDWVFSQLTKMADLVGLSLGITIENGCLLCKLCDCKFGECLVTAEAYHHVNATATSDVHKEKVQKQISDGLRTYYDDNERDEEFYNHFYDSDGDDDVSFEYELQAPWWSDRSMEYYMAMDAAYNGSDSYDDY